MLLVGRKLTTLKLAALIHVWMYSGVAPKSAPKKNELNSIFLVKSSQKMYAKSGMATQTEAGRTTIDTDKRRVPRNGHIRGSCNPEFTNLWAVEIPKTIVNIRTVAMRSDRETPK